MIHKSLLLTSLVLAPNLSTVPVIVKNNPTVATTQKIEEDIQEQKDESCTFMYVGKDVSANGKTMVARCGDSIPRGMNLNAQIFKHNYWANQVVKGKDGFEWRMPSTTYRYISTPRNPLVKNGLHWEVSGINENGVCVSATLTCNTNKIVKEHDPFIKTGITEDNLTQIVAATATSARNGIQTVANIIDTNGNGGNEAIMVMDRDETWYMELYSGHQYLAIKMPTDKACAMGNEFSIDTIDKLNLSKNEYIASKDLLNLPVDNSFAKFDDTGLQTLEHLDLYKTYAGGEKQGTLTNGCHMRTWRARDLFAKEKPDEYKVDSNLIPTEKYDMFWTPQQPMSVNDVISYMRDRYENILNDETHPEHDKLIAIDTKEKENGGLRVVGSNTTYQVHIMSINPDLPKELCCEEWIAMSSANYTPFTLVNSGVTELDPRYTHVIQDYGFDDQAACCIYKILNSTADLDREHYGLPIQNFISLHESIWQKQYSDLIPQIKDMSANLQRNVLTNYCLETQEAGIAMAKTLYDDLSWHIINPKTDKTFKPFISLEYYGYLYGWDYEFKNDIATLKNGDDTITIDYHYETRPATGWVVGKLTKNNLIEENVFLKTKDGIPFMDYAAAKKYMSDGYKIATINWRDYYTADKLNWVIPVAMLVPAGGFAAIGVPIIVYVNNKKTKPRINKK